MQPFLYYSLKVIICSGILYGYYLLALRNNRFHQWNRWYLLGSVLLSFGLPLLQVPLPDFSEHPAAISYSVALLAAPDMYFSARQPQGVQLTWETVALATYGLVVLCLLFFFLRQLRHIQLLKQRYNDEAGNGIHFYLTTEPGTPFSFFRSVFWNTGIDLHTSKGQQMLRHEMAHVTEWHSADKVLLEMATVVAFWNPFLHLIKKELSVVHEFIADQKASANNDRLEYASLLLMKALGSPAYTLSNPFFHSQLKRRIMMLTRSKNPRFSYIRRVLVLPLAAISLVLFSFKYKEIKDEKQKAESRQPAMVEEKEKTFDGYQDTTKKKRTVILTAGQQYKGSLIRSLTPTDDLKGAVIKTANGNTYFVDRKEAASELGFVINDTGFVTPKNARVVLYDSNGVPPDNYSNYTTIIDKPLEPTSIIRLQDPATGNLIIRSKMDTSRQPLYILEGKELSLKEMKAIDPAKIQSINVLKGEQATTIYGSKGGNGVVEIKLKNALPDDVLYLLDGVESTKEKVQAINPANVQSVNVWKGEAAIEKWGQKGRNGVVDMQTKLAKNEVTFDNAPKHKIDTVTWVKGYPVKGTATTASTASGNVLKEVTVVGYGPKQDYEKIFTKVQEPASFPGGPDGWRRYLMRNLQYPEAAQKNGTQGTVQVQLVVNEEGNITDVRALNNPGNGLAEEAVRLISKGPKWVPARQNQQAVIYRFVQPITFNLQ